MKLNRLILVITALVFCAAFSLQPMDERTRQNALPQSTDPTWALLERCKVSFDNKTGYYSVKFTDEIQKMKGNNLSVSGFMMPLEAQEVSSHFLLSKRTPTCPFCPPGEPNEVIEVRTKTPVKFRDEQILVSGKLELSGNKESFMFFRLDDAVLVNIKDFKPKEKQVP